MDRGIVGILGSLIVWMWVGRRYVFARDAVVELFYDWDSSYTIDMNIDSVELVVCVASNTCRLRTPARPTPYHDTSLERGNAVLAWAAWIDPTNLSHAEVIRKLKIALARRLQCDRIEPRRGLAESLTRLTLYELRIGRHSVDMLNPDSDPDPPMPGSSRSLGVEVMRLFRRAITPENCRLVVLELDELIKLRQHMLVSWTWTWTNCKSSGTMIVDPSGILRKVIFLNDQGKRFYAEDAYGPTSGAPPIYDRWKTSVRFGQLVDVVVVDTHPGLPASAEAIISDFQLSNARR